MKTMVSECRRQFVICLLRHAIQVMHEVDDELNRHYAGNAEWKEMWQKNGVANGHQHLL